MYFFSFSKITLLPIVCLLLFSSFILVVHSYLVTLVTNKKKHGGYDLYASTYLLIQEELLIS